jgi:hypothetical protein
MKRTVVILFCIMVTQLFTSCYKTDDGTFTDPITIYEKMAGTWATTSVTQFDLIAVAAATKPDKVNLTAKFNFKTFAINFAVDEKFNPTTFAVEGTSPELFLKSGYWKLNNPFPNTDGTPLVIELYSDAAKTQLADQLNISVVPGAKANLQFDLIRKTDNIPFVSYQYLLKPVK